MSRVKVLIALQGDRCGGLTARQLHEHLARSGDQLSSLSVYQVIGRLCELDILVRVGQGQYRLDQAVLSVLGQGLERPEFCTVGE